MPSRRHVLFHRKKRNGPAAQPTGANNIAEQSASQPIDIPLSVERSIPRPSNVLGPLQPPHIAPLQANPNPSRVADHGESGAAVGPVPESLCLRESDLLYPPRLANELAANRAAIQDDSRHINARAINRQVVLSNSHHTDALIASRAATPFISRHINERAGIRGAIASSSRRPDEVAADSEAILHTSSRHNILRDNKGKTRTTSGALAIPRRSAMAQGGRRHDNTQISPARPSYNSANDYSDSGVSTVDSTRIVIGGQGYRSNNGTFAGALRQLPGTTTWLSPSTFAPSHKSAGGRSSPSRRGNILSTTPENTPPDTTTSRPTASSSRPTASSSNPTPSRPPLPPFQTSPPDPIEHGTIIQRGGFMDLSPPDEDAIDPYQYDEILRQRKIKAHEDFLVALEEVRQEIGRMKERQEREAEEERERMLERIRRGRLG